MQRIDPKIIKRTKRVLKKKRVFTLSLLLSHLKCSPRSGRKILKEWGTYTSYNQNGCYYVLPDVPKFDKDGLWKWKDVFFSKYGTLKRSVIYLIQTSAKGLTCNELCKITDVPLQGLLCHLRDTPGILREKYDGSYVYFSDDNEKYKVQVSNRLDSLALSARYLSDADAVIILVAIIKHHNITADDLAALPEIKEKNISSTILHEFFERHELGKKTPNLKR